MNTVTENLWQTNTPSTFWLCKPNPPPAVWEEAFQRAIPVLKIPLNNSDTNTVLEYSLGEGQFGPDHFQIGKTRKLYYLLKPLLPRFLTSLMRSVYNTTKTKKGGLNWPIEPRFAQFQWEILRQVLLISEKDEILFKYFWPAKKSYAFVLTHDVETAWGQRQVSVLADMEEDLGFRSMFNFVPERYSLDRGLMLDLQKRGFEVGVHGLKHDGKLFNSPKCFSQRANQINKYLAEFNATGFRSPLTLRNPAWMQMLKMDYDLSFFDTDPYEPMPGGVMSIWPFMIGNFLELPYTLPQDFTLFNLMGEKTPAIWLDKIDFLKKYHGMALVIVHPDYSSRGKTYQIYTEFLHTIKGKGDYWHAVPCEVAAWWKNRSLEYPQNNDEPELFSSASLNNNSIQITI